MRYLGLDLGTKTLGIAITDKTRTISQVLKVIRFKEHEYETIVDEVINIIKEYDIQKIVLGYPKNMNNTDGYASVRSQNFKELLMSKTDVPIILIDERLSTVEAENILLSGDVSRHKRKKVIDGIAAQIILETFLKMEENKNE